jgi:hypothetical protein
LGPLRDLRPAPWRVARCGNHCRRGGRRGGGLPGHRRASRMEERNAWSMATPSSTSVELSRDRPSFHSAVTARSRRHEAYSCRFHKPTLWLASRRLTRWHSRNLATQPGVALAAVMGVRTALPAVRTLIPAALARADRIVLLPHRRSSLRPGHRLSHAVSRFGHRALPSRDGFGNRKDELQRP